MKHGFLHIALGLAMGTTLMAQSPNVNSADDEFPGLQLLPPGSKVRGISVPRYDNHKVCAFLMATELEVVSRTEVTLSGIRAMLYEQEGEDNTDSATNITCDKAGYDFKRKVIISLTPAEVNGPKFSAKGNGVVFSLTGRIGLIKGPVRTTIRSGKPTQTK